MPARTRRKVWSSGQSGLAHWDGFPAGDRRYTPAPNWVITSDVTGNPKGDNAFHLERKTIEGFSPVNGAFRMGGQLATVASAVPASVYIGAHAVAKRVGGSYSDAVEAVANANPSNPLIALPTFLFELKDLPGMLKHAGSRALQLSKRAGNPPISQIGDYLSSPKAVAQDWLNYKFGWAPFLSDLADIAGISEDMARRHKTLAKGARRGFIVRRSQLGSNTTFETKNSVMFDNFMFDWYGHQRDEYTTKRWCVSKWAVDPYSYSGSLNDNAPKLLKQSLGLDLSFQNLWNVIPWSWMVDWFSNVSSMVQLNMNRHGVRFHSMCTMEHNVATRTITPYPNQFLTSGPAVIRHETKSRVVGIPLTFQDGVDYLSPSQLGTLAALKVSRS